LEPNHPDVAATRDKLVKLLHLQGKSVESAMPSG
jgi:hypothetical protein